jgi:hypothetical protein
VKSSTSSGTSATGRAAAACVIIEADAWLIEQPWPVKRTARSRPSSTWTCSEISSPHTGLSIDTVAVGRSSVPWFRGRR